MSTGKVRKCKICGGTEWYASGGCKACVRNRAKRYYELHGEERKEYSRKYDHEHREQIYRKRVEYHRQYRNAHKDHQVKITQEWRLRNREKVLAGRKRYQSRRYAWLRAGDVSAKEMQEIYSRDGGRCVYCGIAVTAKFFKLNPKGFDHILPLSRGGTHTKNNLIVCCAECNLKKGPKKDYVIH